jgi:hypothetical protein
MDFAHDDLARRGHGYLFNLSAGRSTYLASLGRGWQATLPLGLMCHHARNAPAPAGAEPFTRLDRLGSHHGSGGRIVVTDRPCPQEMAGLVGRLEMDGRFRHVRDTRYFAWRFQNPLARYRFLLLREGGALDGYLVLQTPATGHRGRVAILDWEASTLSGRAELLEAAVEWGQFTDLRLWSGTLTSPDRDVLRSRDFLPASVTLEASAHRSTVLVRALGLAPTDPADWVVGGRRLLDLGNWDVRMLYSDAF